MIKYALRCDNDHRWDAWFESIAGFDSQSARGLVECPFCGSIKVEKAPMAPAVAKGAAELPAVPVATAPDSVAETPDLTLPEPVREFFAGWREHIARNYDYVGDSFAREARAIHEGDSEERLIYGQTTPAEARALIEDGIPVAPLPPLASPKGAKAVN